MKKTNPIKRVKIIETRIPLERLAACKECLPPGIEGNFDLILPNDVASITVACKKHGRSKTIAQRLPRKR